MARYELIAEQWVQARPAEVVPFFEAPENLEQLTPPFLKFRIQTQSPLEMRVGAVIDYAISLRGLPLRWRTLIEEYEPGVRFVDLQVRGPYRLWRHTHTFAAENGGTRIADRVELELPFGPLGDLALRLFVRRDLDAIFSYRHREVARRFGGPSDPAELLIRRLEPGKVEPKPDVERTRRAPGFP